MSSCAFEIEGSIEARGIFKEALRNTRNLYKIDIIVKPWIGFRGISNARVEITDELGLFPKQGRTNEDGKFETEVLSGEATIQVFTGNKVKTKTEYIDGDKKVKIHPSIF